MVKKPKLILRLVAAIVVAIVAFFKPEYTENVARAFILLIAGV